MNELINWLNRNKISFHRVDDEVLEIEDFGKLFCADLSNVKSIFRGGPERLEFNLMESPEVLILEGIYYVAFAFGKNWYYYDLREDFRFNLLKYIGKREKVKLDIPFVNLGVHTPFELLNGSGDIGTWVKKAKYLGHEAIGICDYNTMAGTLHLQKECGKQGLKHVFGYSLTMEHRDEKVEMKVYCQSQTGLQNLLRIQKSIMVDNAEHTIGLDELLTRGEGNVVVFGKLASYWMRDNGYLLGDFVLAFEKVYYQVDLNEYKADRIDREVLGATKHYFDNFYSHEEGGFFIEPVLICDNYYLDKDDYLNKIVLNKVASGAAHNQSEEQYFKDVDEHFEVFSSIVDGEKWDVRRIFERMCKHTVEIAERAEAAFQLGQMHMPEYIMREEEQRKYGSRHCMFSKLLQEGLKRKIPVNDQRRYRERLREEVYIIESTNNIDYFLILWDLVKEAKRREIATGIGRGSAGGSLVSYLLDIISIDPLHYDLIFSRFLVPERCGLKWDNEVTKIGEDIELEQGESYVEIVTDKGDIHLYKWSKIRVCRGEETLTVYANDLQESDVILFDNRDLLWTLNDIIK